MKLIVNFLRYLVLAPVLLGASVSAYAELKTEEIEYQVNGESFTGYLAYDDEFKDERPVVLVVHEWCGLGDYSRKRADMLARLGYTAFALDMYGSDKYAEHPGQANEFMQTVLNNQEVAKDRFISALELLRKQPTVASDQIAALGYCFGGAVVLHMARAGLDLDGVVSYHGMLGTDNPASEGSIEAQILAFTGEDDAMVPKEQVENFKQEMTAAKADFTLHSYEGAKHGFTNPEATESGERFDLPLAYDAQADADSWHKTQQFLERLFQ